MFSLISPRLVFFFLIAINLLPFEFLLKNENSLSLNLNLKIPYLL